VLESIIARSATGLLPEALMVGLETSDDAAVYRLNDTQALVATTDFFMPVVDDPFDFGAIAATNALSDIYAMGGRPTLALAVVGMPIARMPAETIRRILEGGVATCNRAGIPMAGGHSIDSAEPIYGLVALGLVDPRQVKRNADARAGDRIILGKPLGVGIYSAAIKKERLDGEHYAALVANATQLNTPGIRFATLAGVHALTDVTGFGLLGHLLEICRASGVSARLDYGAIPFLPGVEAQVADGVLTGASQRNWESYGARVDWPGRTSAQQALLTDPQTSGGLLVTCAPQAVDEVLRIFHEEGFARASVIGEIADGQARVTVS
jgi:selenide,water dikinase